VHEHAAAASEMDRDERDIKDGPTPLVRGCYYMNSLAREAIEGARAAEDRLRGAGWSNDEDEKNGDSSSETDVDSRGPVHRVEIEATEVVPSATGQATRGYVARVPRGASSSDVGSGSARLGTASPPRNARPTSLKATADAGPETHVFSDHRDLVSLLGDELGK
jgi:hypothetical protein